jgi:IS30 family transposase
MELTLGMFGNKKHSNAEIAQKLGRSPGAITQRKIKIQQLLDQEYELSPFIAG